MNLKSWIIRHVFRSYLNSTFRHISFLFVSAYYITYRALIAYYIIYRVPIVYCITIQVPKHNIAVNELSCTTLPIEPLNKKQADQSQILHKFKSRSEREGSEDTIRLENVPLHRFFS